MVINTAQFRVNCLELIDEVYMSNQGIIITKHGKALAKLARIKKASPKKTSIIGSLTGMGKTNGDLTEPFSDEWELDSLNSKNEVYFFGPINLYTLFEWTEKTI